MYEAVTTVHHRICHKIVLCQVKIKSGEERKKGKKKRYKERGDGEEDEEKWWKRKQVRIKIINNERQPFPFTMRL